MSKLLKRLGILVALFSVGACGGGGDAVQETALPTPATPQPPPSPSVSSTWDDMQWDQGRWGP